MYQIQNIQTVLSDAARSLQTSSDSALLDSELLLGLALGADRSYLRAWPERPVPKDRHRHFLTLLEQRRTGMPIAYITGKREFWSREFDVTPDVLIPRPDTELLIELSLRLLPPDEPANVIDLGTGSGIIAITLAAERPRIMVSASDNSPAALQVAQRNAEKHAIRNLRFYLSDWFAAVPPGPYDLVVSNPPYIAPEDSHLRQGDLRFEPPSALCAAEQGLAAINIIAYHARYYLKPGGHLLIEHGYDQREQVQAIFAGFDYRNIQCHNDLAGNPRTTYGQKPT